MITIGWGDTEGQENKQGIDWKGACRVCLTIHDSDKKPRKSAGTEFRVWTVIYGWKCVQMGFYGCGRMQVHELTAKQGKQRQKGQTGVGKAVSAYHTRHKKEGNKQGWSRSPERIVGRGNDGKTRGAWVLWVFILQRGFHICMHRPQKTKQTHGLDVNEHKRNK